MSKSKLRLGPLPSNTSVKLTFTCPASLKTELDRYAALHAQLYGETVDAAALIPHMLLPFMARDRGSGGAGRTTPIDREHCGAVGRICQDSFRLIAADQV